MNILAKKLQRGDTVGIVSPSGPVTKDVKGRLDKGMDVLKSMGFKVRLSKNALANSLGYSATPQEKADDMNTMFADEEVLAIICSQGGSNSNSVLPLLDFETITKNPKIFLGISDITVLLNAIWKKTGLVTFHGNDVMWGFGSEHTDYDVREFGDRLMGGKIGEVTQNSDWKCIREGAAEGVLVGGNLNCINKLVGTDYSPDFKDKILFLETYGESGDSPGDVECELYQLKMAGAFDNIKGLWLGHYEHNSGISYEEIVTNVIGNLNLPILKCDDFGHNTPNTTIPVGNKVNLDATGKKVVLLEKSVE